MYTIEEIAKVESRFQEPASPEEMRKYKSVIVMKEEYEAGLDKIAVGDLLQIVFYLHQIEPDDYQLTGPRHHGEPRGVFASRSPKRPSPIGITTVKLLGRKGRRLTVRGLDAINGTPVIDIKPYASLFDQGEGIEPAQEVKEVSQKSTEPIEKVGYEDLGFAKIDHDRKLRKGFPEVIYCEGKTIDQVVTIAKRMALQNDNFLASRANPEMFTAVKEELPEVRYNRLGRMIIREEKPLKRVGHILVVSAGTSDLPVVEEAAETAAIMGNKVETLSDVGVAGIHRLLNNVDYLNQAKVIIVVAGMEGALPSVIAGLVSKPIIAVPTSVGYGANLQGIAPMLTMLNSCAAGIGVVNIDNGFGAAYLANSINKIGEEVK